jgi:hypothetical protein
MVLYGVSPLVRITSRQSRLKVVYRIDVLSDRSLLTDTMRSAFLQFGCH